VDNSRMKTIQLFNRKSQRCLCQLSGPMNPPRAQRQTRGSVLLFASQFSVFLPCRFQTQFCPLFPVQSKFSFLNELHLFIYFSSRPASWTERSTARHFCFKNEIRTKERNKTSRNTEREGSSQSGNTHMKRAEIKKHEAKQNKTKQTHTDGRHTHSGKHTHETREKNTKENVGHFSFQCLDSFLF